jgi:hypothetical protein
LYLTLLDRRLYLLVDSLFSTWLQIFRCYKHEREFGEAERSSARAAALLYAAVALLSVLAEQHIAIGQRS